MNIEHVFFDLDHTLWDFERNSALAFKKLFADKNIIIDFDVFIKAYTPINFHYWKLYREEKVSKPDLRYGRLKDTFDQLRMIVSDEMINELSEDYIHYLPHFNHLFDGVEELLIYLKGKYQLHIITNGFEEVQTKKLKSSGIYGFFEEVITSESVGVKKPNPKVFNYALKVANAKPQNSMMVGDNIEADILGAMNCGIRAIHCNFEKNGVIPTNITSVTHLLEIKQYL